MQAEPGTVTYFGKIPTHGDFVRHRAHGPAVRALDDWLQQGLYATRLHRPRALDDFAREATTYAFYFDRGEPLPALVGVLGPSRDRVGRTYPFFVTMEVDRSQGPDIAQAPLHHTAFLERAAGLARDASAGLIAYQELAVHADRVLADGLGRSSSGTFNALLQQTALRSFWEWMWGYAGDSRKYLLFKNLLDIVLPLQDGIPTSFALALRFPLSTDETGRAFEVGVWLDVCRRLLRGTDWCPTYFWTWKTHSAANPFLLLTLRPAPAKALAYVLAPEADGDTLCDLETMGRQQAFEAALAIPARYGQLLESDTLNVFDFLQRL